MKKKRTKKQIAFNDEGMRSFNSVNEAIEHFAHETNDVRKIVKMFASAHEVKFGRGSFNVSKLKTLSGSQRNAEIERLINTSAQHAVVAFQQVFDQWLNKYHVEVIDRAVDAIVEPISEKKEEVIQPNEDVVNEEVID
jgi:chemotaxis protein histidine kinase CheA